MGILLQCKNDCMWTSGVLECLSECPLWKSCQRRICGRGTTD